MQQLQVFYIKSELESEAFKTFALSDRKVSAIVLPQDAHQ